MIRKTGDSTTDLQIGDLFKFKDEASNITQNWMVTDITIPMKSEYKFLIHFEPEHTPVANSSKYRFGSMEIIKQSK